MVIFADWTARKQAESLSVIPTQAAKATDRSAHSGAAFRRLSGWQQRF